MTCDSWPGPITETLAFCSTMSMPFTITKTMHTGHIHKKRGEY